MYTLVVKKELSCNLFLFQTKVRQASERDCRYQVSVKIQCKDFAES